MPYLPQATFEQILAYRPEDISTHTPSPIVNAVAEVLYTTLHISGRSIAKELQVDENKLSNALYLDCGMMIGDLIHKYRAAQLEAFIQAHPEQDYTVDELAHALGYASGKSIVRFVRTQTGKTLRGRKSYAGPDSYVKFRSELRKKSPGSI